MCPPSPLSGAELTMMVSRLPGPARLPGLLSGWVPLLGWVLLSRCAVDASCGLGPFSPGGSGSVGDELSLSRV